MNLLSSPVSAIRTNLLALLRLTAGISLLFTGHAMAEIPLESEDWTLRTEKEGVKIFAKEHQDSDFKAFKAVTILNAPLNNVMAVMANPNSCVEWVNGCSESYGVREGNFNDRFAYSVNDLPWPFKDRDYVLSIKTSNDAESGRIFMQMSAVDGEKPESEFVRISISETYYEFEAADENSTRFTWLQHTDPAGALPSWLVNAMLVDMPFKSIKSLEKVAQEARYQNATLKFDQNNLLIGVEYAE